MKKLLLTLVALGSMVFSANAATYMRVHTNDGQTKKYDVENVTLVDYEVDSTGGVTVSGKVGNYTYVDLGLASGTKWATYNVGASKPTDYGDYFAWGETTPKEDYDWNTYKWCNGSRNTHTKYCTDSVYGTLDSLTTLLAEDDAATVYWGDGWRMPTRKEHFELKYGCDWKWTDDFNGCGVAGVIGTSKTNGNTIFFPAAGYFNYYSYTGVGFTSRYGNYWSSSLVELYPYEAYSFEFSDLNQNGNVVYDDVLRFYGLSVRAVVK